MHGLESARGFIQSKVADRIQTRQTPVLKFMIDTSVKKSADISKIIDDALADGMVKSPEEEGDADSPESEIVPDAEESLD